MAIGECRRCGRSLEVNDAVSFCPSCGSLLRIKVEEAARPEANRPSRKRENGVREMHEALINKLYDLGFNPYRLGKEHVYRLESRAISCVKCSVYHAELGGYLFLLHLPTIQAYVVTNRLYMLLVCGNSNRTLILPSKLVCSLEDISKKGNLTIFVSEDIDGELYLRSRGGDVAVTRYVDAYSLLREVQPTGSEGQG